MSAARRGSHRTARSGRGALRLDNCVAAGRHGRVGHHRLQALGRGAIGEGRQTASLAVVAALAEGETPDSPGALGDQALPGDHRSRRPAAGELHARAAEQDPRAARADGGGRRGAARRNLVRVRGGDPRLRCPRAVCDCRDPASLRPAVDTNDLPASAAATKQARGDNLCAVGRRRAERGLKTGRSDGAPTPAADHRLALRVGAGGLGRARDRSARTDLALGRAAERGRGGVRSDRDRSRGDDEERAVRSSTCRRNTQR